MVDAGYPLTLWARRAESLQPYADTPARRTASIAELGAACEQVGICVVDDAGVQQVCDALIPAMRAGSRIVIHATVHPRSEEHTSELQSLMRISYAVFCLKKKKHNSTPYTP